MYGLEEGEEYKPWLWRPPEGGVIAKHGLRRKDGYEKASGKAVYTRDVSRPGMLFAKPLTVGSGKAPYVHATIKSMDTSKAEALAGVRAVLRYDDPDIAGKWYTLGLGARILKYDLVSGIAHWYAQPVGAVVCADSEQIVDQALKLIEIEWEELPVIIDWDEVLKPGAPLLRPDLNPDSNLRSERVTEYGDIEAGLAEADKVIEFQQYGEEDVWAGVEPMSNVAEWKGDDNLEIWLHSNSIGITEYILARYAPLNKIFTHQPYMGGTFGGTSTLRLDCVAAQSAAIAAKRAGRPVKMLFDGSHFFGSGEHCGTYNFKVGFRNDGTITAVKIDSMWCNATIDKLHKGTKIPNQYLKKIDPYLSRGQTTCYRHGAPACSIITLIYEHVAGELGMDPTEVALINDGCEGISMADMADIKAEQGFDPTRDSLREGLEIGKAAIDWDNKWHLPGTKILPNGNYHGLGFTWSIGWQSAPGVCTVGLSVESDGTVNIIGRRPNCGVASASTYSQVVADELGMRYEDVEFNNFHHGSVGLYLGSPGGSSGLAKTNGAMVRVARKMKQLILEDAVKPGLTRAGVLPAVFPDKTPEELDIWNSEIFEKANPENKAPVAEVAFRFNRGSPSNPRNETSMFAWDDNPDITAKAYVMVRQCYFMEVEVNPETGQTEVKKVAIVNDAGQVINPDAFNGQQYGGMYMGIGRSRDEAVYYDPQTGVKLNDNLIGYEITLMNDSGPIDCHILETHLGHCPYGACGIGEPCGAIGATLTGPAIYNAIGKYVDDFPTTPDKVLKALGKV